MILLSTVQDSLSSDYFNFGDSIKPTKTFYYEKELFY